MHNAGHNHLQILTCHVVNGLPAHHFCQCRDGDFTTDVMFILLHSENLRNNVVGTMDNKIEPKFGGRRG